MPAAPPSSGPPSAPIRTARERWPGRWLRWLAPHRWALLALGIGAALPLLRVFPAPASTLPGSPAGDVFKHAWPYWHTLALANLGGWPTTPFLAAPDGGTLLDVMLLPSILLAPITLLGGPVLACNTWLWLSLLAVGLSVYALCHLTTGHRLGSATAGLIAQTTPYLLGHGITSGVHERLSVWVFALLALAVLRARDERLGPLRLSAAVAVLSLATFHCHTFGVHNVALSLLLLPVVLWPFAPSTLWPRARRLAPLYLGLAASFALVFLLARWFVGQPDFLAGVPQERTSISLGVTASYLEVATPGALFHPGVVLAQAPKLFDDELHNLCYAGWIPLLAMLAGAVLAWRRGQWRVPALVGVALVFLLMSLGPVVVVAGWQIENPFYLTLANLLPMWGGLPAVWELVALFAVLGSAGIAALVSTPRSRRGRLALSASLLLATLGERALVLPVPVLAAPIDARVSSVYDHAQGEGALVDLPRVWRDANLTRGTMFLAQTRHEHPIPAGINLGVSRWDTYDPLLDGTTQSWAPVVACLRSQGFRWLVVHRDWFASPQLAARTLEGLGDLGRPIASEEEETLFDLTVLAPAATPDPRCPSE